MTSTGNVMVNTIVLTDSLVIPASCPVTTLAPNADTTCTASYATTLADYNASSLTNTATASGQDLQGGTATSDPDGVTVNLGTPVAVPEPDSLIDLLYGLARIVLVSLLRRRVGE